MVMGAGVADAGRSSVFVICAGMAAESISIPLGELGVVSSGFFVSVCWLMMRSLSALVFPERLRPASAAPALAASP